MKLTNIFRVRVARRRMKNRLRAAQILFSKGDPVGHFRVFNKMAGVRLKKIRRSYASAVKLEEYEICLRQKLVQQLTIDGFLGELSLHVASSGGSICAPVPQDWRKFLIASGVELNNVASLALWCIKVARAYAIGVRRIMQLILHSLLSSGRMDDQAKELVLPGLIAANMPTLGEASRLRHDFVSWIVQREQSNPCTQIRAHVPRSAVVQILPNVLRVDEIFHPINLPNCIGFAVRAFIAAFQASVGMLFLKWNKAYMLADEIELLYLQHSHRIAARYVFCNSDFQLRPLWTYAAERKGAHVSYAFYSRNSQVISLEDQESIPQTPGYSTMSWPNYIVWDNYQKIYIQNATQWNANFDVAGPVDFTDDDSEIPDTSANEITCAVFDVSAFQPLIAAERGVLDPYYTVDIVNAFLDDVSEALSAAGVVMYYKRKRPFIRIAATAYKKHVDCIAKKPGVILVNPEVSATRLIKKCDFVISIPYTSTADIGAAQMKPTVYYDSTGRLPIKKELAHGHLVLRGKAELKAWISEVGISIDRKVV